MQLNVKHDIENNVYSTAISIDSFGTEQLSEDEERESLHDYPAKIAYRNLVFTKNVKIESGRPVVTDVEATQENAETVRTVTLPPISNKEIALDENFSAMYRVDATKILGSSIDANVLTNADLVARAYIAVFDAVINDAVDTAMQSIRAKAPAFTEEFLITV